MSALVCLVWTGPTGLHAACVWSDYTGPEDGHAAADWGRRESLYSAADGSLLDRRYAAVVLPDTPDVLRVARDLRRRGAL